MRIIAVALCLLLASSLAAQQVTVGSQPVNPFFNVSHSTPPRTVVDLFNHAPAGGTINKVTLQWNGEGCADAFKIVILRGGLTSVSTFTAVASRGPFSAVSGRNNITLSPPVTIQEFDYIGIVALQPYSPCGSIGFAARGYALITNKDMSTGGAIGTTNNYFSGRTPALFGYNSDPVLVRILPAAGAVQGIGTFFRTSLQLYNATSSAINGKLVFHRAGQSAAPTDPSLDFTLAPAQTRTFADVVTEMGASGLGSLDVLTEGGTVPVVTARVFSDNGAAGTSGFTEEGLPPSDAMSLFTRRGVLPIPTDLTNFRMNVGMRTLDAGATIDVTVYNPAGVPLRSHTITLPPNWFEQQTAGQFTNGTVVPAGGAIRITVTAGSAIVYGTITDNRTSDSSMRIAAID